MKYYLQTNTGQIGPFSIEELKDKFIQPETPIWKEGLSDWVKAQELEELQAHILKTPPVYKQPTEKAIDLKNKQTTAIDSKKTNNSIGRFTPIIAILLILAGLYFYNVSNTTKQARFNSIVSIPPDYEHINPVNYMEATGTYKPIIFSNKWEIDGLIINKASHTNYKDIHIRVNFFSQTNTVIGSADYVLYQYVPQGTTQIFKLQVEKPAAVATCGWIVTGGTWY